MRQAKQVCRELLIGLAVWAVPVAVVLVAIAEHRLAMFAGVAVGTLTAAGMLLHMYHHLDIALDMDARHAQSHTQLAALKRMLAMGVVLAVSMIYPRYIHPLGVVFGLFGTKVTALCNPILHRYIQKVKKKRK